MSDQTPLASAADAKELVDLLQASDDDTYVVATTLRTDERVIARVTDGIYRQPGSALRELISNAYDADATRVIIKTDAPRFERITVEDDGHGMKLEALAHLLFHIGGSAKRSEVGKSLGVTSETNPYYSPGGRRLIGKIGIGLFSVSQLTHSVQIITKVKGENHRTIATIALKQYADDDYPKQGDEKPDFETGKVNVWREKAADTDAQGTTVVLNSIRPQARDTLRSRDIWSAVEQAEMSLDERPPIEPPKYHIGRVDFSGDNLRSLRGKTASVPWIDSDEPKEGFRKLVQSVWDEVENSNPNPQLERIFDYYLRMVWQLSLSVPLGYVSGHLFDLAPKSWADVFALSNEPKGTAKRLELDDDESLRHAMDLKDPPSSSQGFQVFFDQLELLRPIKFTDLPSTNHALKRPLMFLGKCKEEFPNVPRELSTGPLAFEAYLVWTPKVAPTEHQGSLIRIHGSSGTLFDPTFMRYQVSEQTRLRQITCEIFVSEGLDSALNIDRESFNNAHPHAVYITRWLHGALRQLATSQKKLASEVREASRDQSKGAALSAIQKIAADTWEEESNDPASRPPGVELTRQQASVPASKKPDTYIFRRENVVPEEAVARGSSKARTAIVEEKVKAIVQVLASFGLLENLNARRQERLVKAIYRVLAESES
jgi:hypothetical protein